MDFFETLRLRKSTRRFTAQDVSQDELRAILEAANAAPVGSNLYRDVHLSVIRDKALLARLAEAAVRRMADREAMEKLAGEVRGADASRVFDPFYGAPVVIFVSHRKQELQPGIEFANTACVAHSMHLAAAALGLGSVLMWFALESMRLFPEPDNTALLRLPEGFEPLIGLAVGHPDREIRPRELTTQRIVADFIG